MKFQTYGLILLLVILGEYIQIRDAYKSIRPYKYYRPKPRGHKPRWPQLPQPSTRYRHLKRGPPKPHYRPPNVAWKRPRYAPDYIGKEQSYTIEIELPNRHQHGYSRNNDHYHRNFVRQDAHDFYSNDDYLEEDEEFEERVMQTGKKKVRIRVPKGVKPKLRIKISRDDNLTEIVNSVFSSIGRPTLKINSPLSNKKFGQMFDAEWMTKNSVDSFPEALRGA